MYDPIDILRRMIVKEGESVNGIWPEFGVDLVCQIQRDSKNLVSRQEAKRIVDELVIEGIIYRVGNSEPPAYLLTKNGEKYVSSKLL